MVRMLLVTTLNFAYAMTSMNMRCIGSTQYHGICCTSCVETLSWKSELTRSCMQGSQLALRRRPRSNLREAANGCGSGLVLCPSILPFPMVVQIGRAHV